MRCKVISSGKLSDKKAKSVVDENGHCDSKCPFFRLDKETKADALELDAKCFRDGKEITYYDGFLAHCKLQNA